MSVPVTLSLSPAEVGGGHTGVETNSRVVVKAIVIGQVQNILMSGKARQRLADFCASIRAWHFELQRFGHSRGRRVFLTRHLTENENRSTS